MYGMCFYFQAEDGIRDIGVTGVQTCALPIFLGGQLVHRAALAWAAGDTGAAQLVAGPLRPGQRAQRVQRDWESVVLGKSVDLGGRRIIKKKKPPPPQDTKSCI